MEDALYLELHKLSAIKSEEALDQLLSTLWETRKTGLRQKSHFQSLLNLQSTSDLDPVLACLRSLMRKWVRENLSPQDLLKLLPPDLPLDLQSTLVLLLQKYKSKWKEEMGREQELRNTTSLLDTSHSQLDSLPPSLNLNLNNLATLPRLQSMTWSMDNSSSISANRVVVINLKLQDHTKSSLDEINVKFQVTGDSLGAMIKSLTYIREQLSSLVGAAPEPSQKKKKQSDDVI